MVLEKYELVGAFWRKSMRIKDACSGTERSLNCLFVLSAVVIKSFCHCWKLTKTVIVMSLYKDKSKGNFSSCLVMLVRTEQRTNSLSSLPNHTVHKQGVRKQYMCRKFYNFQSVKNFHNELSGNCIGAMVCKRVIICFPA